MPFTCLTSNYRIPFQYSPVITLVKLLLTDYSSLSQACRPVQILELFHSHKWISRCQSPSPSQKSASRLVCSL